MFACVSALLLDFVQILLVVIPLYIVFDIVGDLLWK